MGDRRWELGLAAKEMTMTRPVVALPCVLCVSVVQFRTMTVIEGGFTTETQRTQRRPIEI